MHECASWCSQLWHKQVCVQGKTDTPLAGPDTLACMCAAITVWGPPTAALVAYAATHGFSAAKALWLAVTGIGHQPLQAEGGLLVLAALAAALVYDNGLLAAGRFIGQVCGAADMTQDCACALLWSSIHASRLHALRTGCARVATHAHHECLQDTHTPPLRYTGMVLDYRART